MKFCGKTWGPGEWLIAISVLGVMQGTGLGLSVGGLEYLIRKGRDKVFHWKNDTIRVVLQDSLALECRYLKESAGETERLARTLF